MVNCNNLWYQVIVQDPNALSGSSIYSFLKTILTFEPSTLVAIDDIEGAGISDLKSINNIIEVDILLEAIKHVVQLDWGDFFFIDNKKDIADLKKSYPDIIISTKFTVRAVDDTYFYLYTQNKYLVDGIKLKYNNCEIEHKSLQEYIYPE